MFSTKNLWIHKAFQRRPNGIHKSPVCCQIRDVIDIRSGLFYISDGYFIIPSVIPDLSSQANWNGRPALKVKGKDWIFGVEELKGSLVVLEEYEFRICNRLNVDLYASKARYLTRGTNDGDVTDFNEAVYHARMAYRVSPQDNLRAMLLDPSPCPMDHAKGLILSGPDRCNHTLVYIGMEYVPKVPLYKAFDHENRDISKSLWLGLHPDLLSSAPKKQSISASIIEDLGNLEKIVVNKTLEKKQGLRMSGCTKGRSNQEDASDLDSDKESYADLYEKYIPKSTPPLGFQPIDPCVGVTAQKVTQNENNKEIADAEFERFITRIHSKLYTLKQSTLERAESPTCNACKTNYAFKTQNKAPLGEISINSLSQPKDSKRGSQEIYVESSDEDDTVILKSSLSTRVITVDESPKKKGKPIISLPKTGYYSASNLDSAVMSYQEIKEFYVSNNAYMVKAEKLSTCSVVIPKSCGVDKTLAKSYSDDIDDNIFYSDSSVNQPNLLLLPQNEPAYKRNSITRHYIRKTLRRVSFIRRTYASASSKKRENKVSYIRFRGPNTEFIKFRPKIRYMRLMCARNRGHPVLKRAKKFLKENTQFINFLMDGILWTNSLPFIDFT